MKSTIRRQFASDNYSGICPQAWQAMEEANRGHALPYGEDEYTAKACDMLRDLFETNCDVYFAFNGTAANSLALASMCQSYHSVIGHTSAHIETDECGAPEFFSGGTKILLAGGKDGKIDLREVERLAGKRSDIHYPKPKVITITQATELGTVYSVDEIAEVGETARRLGLKVHMDGARFANAVASLGSSPKDMTWKAGVDVLCFGGVKNGCAVGEAVVFFSRELAFEFDYRCKQAGQLSSKMRFLSAPWIGMLTGDAWLEHARHANACAKRLEERLLRIEGISVLFPCQANSVFVEMSQEMSSALKEKGWHFYTFIGDGGVRLMCSWDTADEDIDALVSDIEELALSRR
ncbi:MAG TPA: low specificity L-threonine aldolase [Deltaproteobacteria bacterium]|nr:low specificity L-threonine aldolase [Deltaproteobacteria bacterium]